jgi:hypothetical protein
MLLFQLWNSVAGLLFSGVVLVVLMLLEHDVVAAGCNWYLHNVNMCSLLKK